MSDFVALKALRQAFQFSTFPPARTIAWPRYRWGQR